MDICQHLTSQTEAFVLLQAKNRKTHKLVQTLKSKKKIQWIAHRIENSFSERFLLEFELNRERSAIYFSLQFALSIFPYPLIPAGPFGEYGDLLDTDFVHISTLSELHWSSSWFRISLKDNVEVLWPNILQTIMPVIEEKMLKEEHLLLERKEIKNIKRILDGFDDKEADSAKILDAMGVDPVISSIPHWKSYAEPGLHKITCISDLK